MTYTTQYTDEELTTNLQNVADDLGKPPTKREYRDHSIALCSAETYCDRFGGWEDALAEAGLPTDQSHRRNPVPNKVETQALLDDIADVAEELGHAPRTTHYREEGTHGFKTVLKRFDSWEDALEAAGVDLDTLPEDNRMERIPTEELLTDLRMGAVILGRAPSCMQMNEYGTFSASVYINRFGSWGEALEAAGLPDSGTSVDLTPEDVLSDEDTPMEPTA